MAITVYRAWSAFSEIKAVPVDRVTASSVYINGRRSGKRAADFYNYFSTWCEAHEFLVAQAEGGVASARSQLAAAEFRLGELNGLKPPEAWAMFARPHLSAAVSAQAERSSPPPADLLVAAAARGGLFS